MAHLNLSQYLALVSSAWQNENGVDLAELLSFRHGHVASPKLQIQSPHAAVERIFEPPLDEIVACHLRCIWAVINQDFVEADRCQSVAVQAFTKLLQSRKDENWLLPSLYTLCLDLRMLALRADQMLSQRGTGVRMERLEKAAELLMSCFRVCAVDNRSTDDNTKRWGMLTLVNQLFKVYFRINKLHLCKPLIRAIESSPYKDNFAISQQITYRYYVGRKAMFDSDYKTADEYLSFAFERCHKKCRSNKRLILIYLVPVKMLLGYMPSRAVLQKYDLMQFWEVVEAVKQGNILELNQVMQRHEMFFIKCGIYLILERLKIITYRNLFKRVYEIMESHQIPIEAMLTALKLMRIEDMDIDETLCIIANLIADGKIKGYISHQHQKLVVSKLDAFPALSTLS